MMDMLAMQHIATYILCIAAINIIAAVNIVASYVKIHTNIGHASKSNCNACCR